MKLALKVNLATGSIICWYHLGPEENDIWSRERIYSMTCDSQSISPSHVPVLSHKWPGFDSHPLFTPFLPTASLAMAVMIRGRKRQLHSVTFSPESIHIHIHESQRSGRIIYNNLFSYPFIAFRLQMLLVQCLPTIL